MVFKDRPTIGVFSKEIPEFQSLKGIYYACNRMNINVRFFLGSLNSEPFTGEDHKIFDLANKKNIDGIIILSTVPKSLFNTREALQKYASSFFSMPVVNFGIALEGIPSICIENKKGIYEMTSHFIKVHGYKQIAYIGGQCYNQDAQLRLKGYKQALFDHGLSFNPDLYYEGRFIVESGVTGCRELFEYRQVNPGAIICANDETAMGVYNYCGQKGISIPGDLAVSGFDNLLNSSCAVPPLTTVSLPRFKSGITAVQLVYEQIENRSVPELTIIETPLVIRRSCGCGFTTEINKGICEDPSVPALSEKEIRTIEEIQKKIFTYIRKVSIIEKPEAIETLSTYIFSIISGPGSTAAVPQEIKKLLYDTELTEYEYNLRTDFLSAFYNELKKVSFFDRIGQRIEGIFSTMVYHTRQAYNTNINRGKSTIIENTIHYRRASSEINLTLDLSDFIDVFTSKVINFGFDFFYLCMWKGPVIGYPESEPYPDFLQLKTGYDGKRVLKGHEKSGFYPADELIPTDLFDTGKSHSAIILPLTGHGYNFGILILSYRQDKIDYYVPLWELLCNSLIVIRLFEEAKQKQTALNEMNISLETKVQERTAALTEANKKLKEMDRLKSNFFANISHELRTPLTLILGPIEGIRAGDYGEMISRENSLFTSVINNGSRLLKHINILLDFSKIEAGKMRINRKRTVICKMLSYYAGILESTGTFRNIIIRLDCAKKEIIGWIDRDLMEKALFNLFSNALKFTPSGGEITISLTGNKQGFSIAVADTGIGIPEDKLDLIFERFTQVDEGSSRQYEGTGIGLAFTKEIVSLHEGTISVNSRIGRGSVFTITLPYGKDLKGLKESEAREGLKDFEELKEKTEQDAEEYKGEELFDVRQYLAVDLKSESSRVSETTGIPEDSGETDERKKILVIDDNQDIRSFLISILEKEYVVIPAENGIKGLEKASLCFPDLIISDVMMPGMSGIEFCTRLKSNDVLKHIPLILLTARTDISLKMDGLNQMADDFLSKPFNSRELKVRVKNLLVNRELHVELAHQQNRVMTSVNYAGKIQNSILPESGEMDPVMADYFILWQPKDIVGGDIYWFKRVGENFLLAVIDCTGHGIPGAFMTMTVQAELNSIVKYVCSDDPGRILKELNNSIKTALKQDKSGGGLNPGTATDDGLDMGLCYCNCEEQTLLFAGARRPLYYIEENILVEVKPDPVSIGYREVERDTCFINHKISLKKRPVFYLASDGYADQPGGKQGFSLGTERLKNKLLEIHREKSAKQKKILEKTLIEYRGEWTQIDDITIVGFMPVCQKL